MMIRNKICHYFGMSPEEVHSLIGPPHLNCSATITTRQDKEEEEEEEQPSNGKKRSASSTCTHDSTILSEKIAHKTCNKVNDYNIFTDSSNIPSSSH